jgi:hypothetical protein
MQTAIRRLSVLALGSLTLLTACKKDRTNTTDDTLSTEQITRHSEDQSTFSGDLDDVNNDFSLAVESSAAFSGRFNNVSSLCNASVAIDSTATHRRITITYNGPDCTGRRIRNGVVVLAMARNSRWRDAGASISASFQNLRIARIDNSRPIILNGTHTVTNVTGGLLVNMAPNQVIRHVVQSSNMSVRFNDSTQRTWQVHRQREFSRPSGSYVLSITGLHSENGLTGIAEWGTTRFNTPFATQITSPIVIREDCQFRVTSGQIKHSRMVASVTATFGLDQAGNPTSCPGTGTYFYKVVWTGPSGTPHTVIRPY